ncbi:MAG TPA: hypothetical protein VHQ21_04500 [Rhodanobacteraceae bacterium]|nr:hypothetical protein [Rhodanobacteraceae bacterium]
MGWLLLQAGSLIFGALDLPNSWVRGLLALLAVGFIPALVFAWVCELTPEGLKRTREVSADASVLQLLKSLRADARYAARRKKMGLTQLTLHDCSNETGRACSRR